MRGEDGGVVRKERERREEGTRIGRIEEGSKGVILKMEVKGENEIARKG